MSGEYHEELRLTDNVRIDIHHNKKYIVNIELVTRFRRFRFRAINDGRLKRILNNYNRFPEMISILEYLELKFK